MKRRRFLKNGLLAAASLVTPGLMADGKMKKPQSSPEPTGTDRRTLSLKGDYYRHYPVDFSKGTSGATGFHGWGQSIELKAPMAETALIPMHIWNIGFHPELRFSPAGKAGPVMAMLEWASRSVPIIQQEIPPILKAAREAQLTVIHVASDEPYAKKYPGYHRTLEIAGDEPPGLPTAPAASDGTSRDEGKANLLFGSQFTNALAHYSPHIDFPDLARPLADEFVVFTTHQLNEVLRSKGIWNLIYIGFALNWCLWFSPCGMVDMSRLGYRCSCIKEAVTAVENKESVVGEMNKQEALWRTSLMFGYIHSAPDFIRACMAMTE